MKLRCPYCKQTFERQERPCCPHCGKGFRFELPRGNEKTAGRKPRLSPRERQNEVFRRIRSNASPFLLPLLLINNRSRIFLWTLVLAAVIAGRLLFTNVYQGKVLGPDKGRRAQRELRVLRTALEWFRADCRRYPTDDEGPKALVRKTGIPGWKGYYIDGLPPDPWGHPYCYGCSNEIVRLFSSGPDGVVGNSDDIPAPEPDWKELLERIDVHDLPRLPTNNVSAP